MTQQQGRSVFHNAEELEEFSGAVAEIAEGDDDFLAAGRKRQADDALDFDRGAPLATGRAFEPTYLGQTGPIEMSGRSRAGLQVPSLRAARPLGRRASL